MAEFKRESFHDQKYIDGEKLRKFHAQFKSAPMLDQINTLQDICLLALKSGQPFIAFDLIQNLPAHCLNDELIHMFGLASITIGSVDLAIKFLDEHGNLKNFSHLTLLGRVYKEAWHRFHTLEHKLTALEMARGYYKKALLIAERAHRPNDIFYSAINLATISLRLNVPQDSLSYAVYAKATCEKLLTCVTDDYWLLATLGEANLLLGNSVESRKYYGQAFSMAENNLAHIASMKKQFDIAQDILKDPLLDSGDIFPIPLVCCFTGHMIDSLERSEKRFANEMVDQVREQIGAAIEENNIGIGFSSAASGSDIIFLQEMQARGLETNIVIPYEIEAFVEKSVRQGGEEWVASFHEVLKKAASLTIIRDDEEHEDNLAFTYTNQVIYGLAKIKVSMLSSELIFNSPFGISGKPTRKAVHFTP